MQPEDEERLRHMLDAARETLSFARGKTRENLHQDRILTLAIVKSLEIIGEAANNVSENTRLILNEIQWLDIIGMRHRLVHAYFDIDLTVLWKTLAEDISPLIAALEAFFENRP